MTVDLALTPTGPQSASAVLLDVMLATQLPAQDIDARRSQRLAQRLQATARDSAFYRRHWRGLGGAHQTPRLESLPPVGKVELMAHWPQWLTDPAVTRTAVQDFMAGLSRCGELFLGRYVVWQSSGSSGEPAVFVQDELAMSAYDALESQRRHTPGIWQRLFDPLMLGERIAFVGAIDGHFASHVTLQRQRRLRPWLAAGWRSFSILQPTARLVDELDAFAPTILVTYPTAAVLLADEARRGTLHIAPREVWTGGETLSPAMRARVEAAFGCALRNSYGASEFLPIAWECGSGRLHVNADWVILEAVDAKYRPVPAGVWSHTSLLTNLANSVQPLVRYELGDQIRYASLPCDCGCALPVIEVLGRRDDALHLRGRDGRLVTLLPLALTTVLEDIAGVHDFQLRQTGDSALQLTLGPAAESAREACRQALLDFARMQDLAPIRLDMRASAALTPGRSGKVRRVCGLAAGAARVGSEP